MTAYYVDGGRDWPEYDCWGLVRHAFAVIHSIELPEYKSLDATNTLQKSKNHAELIASTLIESEPTHGAIAAVVKGRVCEHVGICIELANELMVLEMDHDTGPRVVTVDKFEDDHRHVRYYLPT